MLHADPSNGVVLPKSSTDDGHETIGELCVVGEYIQSIEWVINNAPSTVPPMRISITDIALEATNQALKVDSVLD